MKTAVSTCLNCTFPIVTWWGRDLILIYNDAYLPILGDKHPAALGQKGEECWRELWPVIGPMLGRVLDRGEASPADDLRLMLERSGYPEEGYFSFSYSPIYDETGGVGGVFCPVIETTDKVIGARRLETLRQLAALSRAESVRDACLRAFEVLELNGSDVPFALLYLLSDDAVGGEPRARLAASAGMAAGTPESPLEIALPADGGWPLAAALECVAIIENPPDRKLPTGAWSQQAKESYLAPVLLPGRQSAAGVIVVGLNPHRKLDQNYRSFLDLLTAQVGSTIADVVAYEAERKRAESLAELDRAKTAFFSNVSHEFRTPLTLMLGPLEDVLHDGTARPSHERDQLQTVHRNGLRLLKLVNTLLDFARIEAGRIQASYEATDLAEFTTELAGVFRSAVERAGLRLVVDCPPLPGPVHVDREMWEKVVLNLLSNALKFTFEGEIAVRLRHRENRVELTVRDTGTGIPAHELPHIFERFHRVEGARGRTHEGSGIGLALVRELARLHGGEVQVASIEDQGTTFAVVVPTGTAHLPADRIMAERTIASTATGADAFIEEALRWLPNDGVDRRQEALSPAAASLQDKTSLISDGPSGAGARVLVVDDNADMRDYLRRLLAGRYEVETAQDGQAALEAISRTHPDLVLADIMMPRLDGAGLLRKLREDERTRATPVILLSARAGEEAKIEGLAAGADDYLTKPFSARELLARVEAHLKLKKLREAGARRTAQFETLVNQAPLGVYMVDADFRIRAVNPVALPVFGEFEGGVIGRDFDEVIHVLWEKAYADEIVRIFRRTFETGEPYVTPERAEFRIDRGITEYYEWRIDRMPLPDGRHGVVCYFRDVSAQVRARQKIAENEQRFRALVLASAQIVWTTDADGQIVEDAPSWRAFTGQTHDGLRGSGWLDALHSDDRTRIAQLWRQAVTSKTPFESEYRIRHLSGDWRWTTVRAVPLALPDGTVHGWVGMNIDITDRKQAEQTQRLLVDELSHRVKNTLASVQAIVQHTLRQTRDPADFAASFAGRIQSMARMHTLLSSAAWKGADLREVIRDQLVLGPVDDTRLTAWGPAVRLEPQMALHVALMLHELGTNSSKYGALSCAEGWVTINWTVDDSLLRLHWVERGGPLVAAPSRRGFGTVLIEQSARSEGGSARMLCAAEGVTWEITLRLPARAASTATSDKLTVTTVNSVASMIGDDKPGSRPPLLAGKRFLVVEDEPLVALDLVASLEEAGAEVAATAGTTKEALTLIGSASFDAALLDANLRGRPVDEVAAALTRHRVPFIFVTGYGRESLPQTFATVAFLSKPFSQAELIEAAAHLIGSPVAGVTALRPPSARER